MCGAFAEIQRYRSENWCMTSLYGGTSYTKVQGHDFNFQYIGTLNQSDRGKAMASIEKFTRKIHNCPLL